MSVLAAIFEGQLTDAVAFSTLLTVESLLFAGMGVAITLNAPQTGQRQLAVSPTTAGVVLASLITAVAFSALLVWTSVFAEPWPCDFRGAIVALVVLVTIILEAAFAWYLAFSLRSRGSVPSR